MRCMMGTVGWLHQSVGQQGEVQVGDKVALAVLRWTGWSPMGGGNIAGGGRGYGGRGGGRGEVGGG